MTSGSLVITLHFIWRDLFLSACVESLATARLSHHHLDGRRYAKQFAGLPVTQFHVNCHGAGSAGQAAQIATEISLNAWGIFAG